MHLTVHSISPRVSPAYEAHNPPTGTSGEQLERMQSEVNQLREYVEGLLLMPDVPQRVYADMCANYVRKLLRLKKLHDKVVDE